MHFTVIVLIIPDNARLYDTIIALILTDNTILVWYYNGFDKKNLQCPSVWYKIVLIISYNSFLVWYYNIDMTMHYTALLA